MCMQRKEEKANGVNFVVLFPPTLVSTPIKLLQRSCLLIKAKEMRFLWSRINFPSTSRRAECLIFHSTYVLSDFHLSCFLPSFHLRSLSFLFQSLVTSIKLLLGSILDPVLHPDPFSPLSLFRLLYIFFFIFLSWKKINCLKEITFFTPASLSLIFTRGILLSFSPSLNWN